MCRQKEAHRGGTTIGQRSPTQLDWVYLWLGSMLATCSDISKHLLRGADISICPLGKRERWLSQLVRRHACLRTNLRVCFLRYGWALMCIVLFFTLAWWPGKSPPKGSGMLRRTRQRKLMDLYQAIKIDNCHSSSGCREVSPDQQGLALTATEHTSPSMLQCHLDALSNLLWLQTNDWYQASSSWLSFLWCNRLQQK